MIQRDSLTRATLDTLPFNVAVIDENGTILFTNRAWREFGGVGSGEGEMVGINYFDGIDESDDEYASRAASGLRSIIDGERDVFKLEYPCHSPERKQWFLMRAARLPEREDGHVVVAHIDITQRKIAEIRARERRNELERLVSRIDGLVQDVMEAALQASSREEIEETLCTRLASVEPYVCAWIGHVDLRTDTISPAVVAGREVPPTDATLSRDSSDPTATALRTEETQIVHDPDETTVEAIHTPLFDGTVHAPSDRAVDTSGRAVGAFPLVYGATKYGVLTVYAEGEDVFGEREVAVLEVLARVVSTAINAIESKHILTTDHVVELELGLSDEDVLFTDVATALDCTLVYEGSISHEDGTVTMLFVVHDGTPDAVIEYASDRDDVVDVTRVGANDDIVEFHVDEPPVVAQLAEFGVETTGLIAHGRNIRLTVELPARIDPRTVVELLSELYPSTELVARRDHERPNQTKQALLTSIEDKLTDRQRLALRKAYLGGFFDWPRNVSGEELAASMGISPSTYHQHLRSAERKVIESLFEG